MFEVLLINLASIATLYATEPLLVCVVAATWVQYFTSRIASESGLYIISVLVSTLMVKRELPFQPSLFHAEMWVLCIVGTGLAYIQMNEYVSLVIVEGIAWAWGGVPCHFSQYARWLLLVVCITTRYIWYPETTFYVTMSMMVYCVGVIVARKK